MQMDTRIPLMGQTVNPLQAYTQGVTARDAVEEMNRNNALQMFLQENGQALYAGDQNAIRDFANYDLQGAMGLQQHFEAQRRAAAAAAARGAASQRNAEQEALQRAFDVMGVAHEQGPEAFNAALDSYGYRDEAEQFGINFDNFNQAAAVARAHLGFEQPAAPEYPSDVQSAMIFAEQSGLVPGTEEYQAAMARAGGFAPEAPEVPFDVPSGYMLADPANPAIGVVPIPGFNPNDRQEIEIPAGAYLLDPNNPAAGFSMVPQVDAEGNPVDASAASGEDFDNISTIREDFYDNPATRTFMSTSQAWDRLQELATQESGMADVGLVYGIMKVFDPTSVVREGEFATAENAAGIPEYVRNIYNRTMTGERLGPQQRQELVLAAQGAYNAAERSFASTEAAYLENASGTGVANPRLAVPDLRSTFSAARPAATNPVTAPSNMTPGTGAVTFNQPPVNMGAGEMPAAFAQDAQIVRAAESNGLTVNDLWNVMTPEEKAEYMRRVGNGRP